MSKKVIVIGAGFSGLSAACFLAKDGYEVTVVEKNSIPGGRARKFAAEGFEFDMGPSWYWLPDVFERFFANFDRKPEDYYDLQRLDPSYKVFFENNESMEIEAQMQALKAQFEELEPGSSDKLDIFLKEALYKYKVAVDKLVYKPGLSLLEFLDWSFVEGAFKVDLLNPIRDHIKKFFSNPKLLEVLEFPVLFLGATPQNTPALYSFMNYADIGLGTWYPQGGLHSVAKGIHKMATELGVNFVFDAEVKSYEKDNKQINIVKTVKGNYQADYIVASCDYHHIDKDILSEQDSNYSESYWQGRTMSPSGLIFYLGIDKKLDNILHHNLFFDKSFDVHAHEIYEDPKWPTDPLFYVCAPSLTDDSVAPEGKENLFFLIPLAPGLEDTEEMRSKYFDLVMDRFENLTKQNIRDHIIYKRSYAHKDFELDYNAFQGNAYGMANTLMQTHILRPSIKSKNIKNLFFTGQLTVPGPGVPPSLISGEVVAKEVLKLSKKNGDSISPIKIKNKENTAERELSLK